MLGIIIGYGVLVGIGVIALKAVIDDLRGI